MAIISFGTCFVNGSESKTKVVCSPGCIFIAKGGNKVAAKGGILLLPERRILKTLGRLEGKVGLYLEDVNSGGELFTVNPERAFPAASTIKIPILAALFKRAAEGKLNLTAELSLTPKKTG